MPEPYLYETYICADLDHHPENYDAYWYHSDHLGSSNYITNLAGMVNQHMEYLPFGETLVEEHLNSYNSPYKFNAKEFDAETGWYYYGARYYNPKWSIWLSVDPLADDPEQVDKSPYAFSWNNPIRYVDPLGLKPFDWIKNLETGEVKWFDATGEEALNMAEAYWDEGSVATAGAENPEKYANLGSSFFGPTKGNYYDKAQILEQRKDYLWDVSTKINDKAGVNVGEGGNYNNITYEYLSNKFLGTSSPFGKGSNNSDLPGLVWDYGVSPAVDISLQKSTLSNSAKFGIGMLSTTIGYLLSSEQAGRGSDLTGRFRANSLHEFKTNTINFIDMKTIFEIRLHTF